MDALRDMFSKLRKDGFLLKTKLFVLRWYPSGRSCIRMGNRQRPPQQMPPLMVRKPEWRR
ncbi:hypothetical protein [Anaerobaca lacustris]|uniref:Uncharacterized protein n=1 Tax=Anaerobaca lacustris TaxID=3044600 RepID=A0AAW6TQ34_9BACT|nr:hypothetical protein [Sedimentisphaerales bacterium M17dextr]